jgi:hypothetical protein
MSAYSREIWKKHLLYLLCLPDLIMTSTVDKFHMIDEIDVRTFECHPFGSNNRAVFTKLHTVGGCKGHRQNY